MPETRHFCPHCEEKVSLSTIHRHRQLYYDEVTDTWTRSVQDEMHSDSDPDLGPVESPYQSSVEGTLP